MEPDAAAADFLEYLVGGGGPLEWLGAVVVGGEVGLDRVDQVGDAVEDAPADCLVGELREEDLDHVQPRARGRREVQLEPR
jgi:hypothetical protein